MSQRQLAEAAGVSHSTVKELRGEAAEAQPIGQAWS
jgi:transcriptional regulator with XRE-family HTH domain